MVKKWYKCYYVVPFLCLGTPNLSANRYGSFPVNIRCRTVLPYIKCRLKVFEKGVLRRIFELKRDEVTGEKKKLHNEELHVHEILFG